jgi:hypothetical protein
MPTGYLPICLFVVNAEGYLADIYQQHGEVHGQTVRCPKAWFYIGFYSCDQPTLILDWHGVPYPLKTECQTCTQMPTDIGNDE